MNQINAFYRGGGRRRLFLDSNKTSDAKYPLINGKHEFNDGSSVEITNGNHVKIIKNSSGFSYWNISNIHQNTNSINSTNNINNLNAYLNIPPYANTLFKILNVTGIGSYDGQTNFKYANSITSADLHTGSFTVNNPMYNTVVELQTDRELEMGCLFVYSTMSIGCELEFDVEFYVNGERWI